MTNGILNIIQDVVFSSADELTNSVNSYFNYIKGEYSTPADNANEKKSPVSKMIWDREPEPATITGLALFLGFNSRQAFEAYEKNGELGYILKNGRLRIELAYEKKLHQQPSGVVFALKTMGWNDKPERNDIAADMPKVLEVKITETGPLLAQSEIDVVL